MPAQLCQPREVEFGPDVKVLFMQTPGGLKIMVGLKGRGALDGEAGTLALCHSEGVTPLEGGVWIPGFPKGPQVPFSPEQGRGLSS